MEWWNNGFRTKKDSKMIPSAFHTQYSIIPTFHHSGTRQKSKPQKSLYIQQQQVVEISRR